jgi:fructose-bisphosphate aldolase, class II
MLSLRDALEQSQKDGVAIGHFNVADWVLLKAVVAAAQELKVPVVVGASEGEREFAGVRQIAALVRSLREEYDCPIFLNADHTHSLPKAVEAARAGFDAIVFDLSALPFEQNVRQTKEAVEALKTINPAILVEGEIGDIGTGSEIHEKAPDLSRGLTSPAEAKQFVETTGGDILAPAVGNMHGMLKSMVQGQTRKRLDIKRIVEIKNAAQVPLTLFFIRLGGLRGRLVCLLLMLLPPSTRPASTCLRIAILCQKRDRRRSAGTAWSVAPVVVGTGRKC